MLSSMILDICTKRAQKVTAVTARYHLKRRCRYPLQAKQGAGFGRKGNGVTPISIKINRNKKNTKNIAYTRARARIGFWSLAVTPLPFWRSRLP